MRQYTIPNIIKYGRKAGTLFMESIAALQFAQNIAALLNTP